MSSKASRINKAIQDCYDVEGICWIVSRRLPDFNEINVITALHRFASMGGNSVAEPVVCKLLEMIEDKIAQALEKITTKASDLSQKLGAEVTPFDSMSLPAALCELRALKLQQPGSVDVDNFFGEIRSVKPTARGLAGVGKTQGTTFRHSRRL